MVKVPKVTKMPLVIVNASIKDRVVDVELTVNAHGSDFPFVVTFTVPLKLN